MWSNNTGNVNSEGGHIEVFKMLNGHEHIDPNIFLKIETGKIIKGRILR